jgi:hypothetical protein
MLPRQMEMLDGTLAPLHVPDASFRAGSPT